jgi:YjbE family integral membrane protein
VGLHIDASFCLRFLTIAAINLVLSADNGLVIALAVGAAPPSQRTPIMIGSAVCAVAFQSAATLFAAELLALKFLRLAGGTVILWISLRLLRGGARQPRTAVVHVGLWHSIWLVVLANFAVSTDNTLAIAGAAQGDVALLIAGLALSIPVVVLAGDLLARAMERFPIVTNLGAAALAVIGLGLIMTDPVLSMAQATAFTRRSVEAGAAVAILVIGRRLRTRHATSSVAGSNSTEQTPRHGESPRNVTEN